MDSSPPVPHAVDTRTEISASSQQSDASRGWRRLKLVVRGQGRLHYTFLQVKARRASDSIKRAISKPSLSQVQSLDKVVTHVQKEEDLARLPWWKQGDPTLYSESRVTERYLLRIDPAVGAALHEWWEATLRSHWLAAGHVSPSLRRPIGLAWRAGGAVAAEGFCYDRSRWGAVHRAIYEHLVPGRRASSLYQAEATAAADADWARDADGATRLGRTGFLDGIFELADLHVPGVGAESYATFIRDLLASVSIAPAGQPPLLWRPKRDLLPGGSRGTCSRGSKWRMQIAEEARVPATKLAPSHLPTPLSPSAASPALRRLPLGLSPGRPLRTPSLPPLRADARFAATRGSASVSRLCAPVAANSAARSDAFRGTTTPCSCSPSRHQYRSAHFEFGSWLV